MPDTEAGSAPGVVLVVDDDATFRSTIAREFARRSWRVATAETFAAAAEVARACRPTVVVLDLRLGDDNGLDLIEALRRESPATRIVMATGHSSFATAVEAMKRGAHHFVSKPCSIERLLAAAAARTWADEMPAHASLAQTERAYIDRVIAACDGNISEAARRLGMHRRSLQRKLRKDVAPPKSS